MLPVFYITRKKKGKKSYWFSSLGQMIQFYTVKFRGTLLNYSGLFVWIDKKSLL